ncbi:hypothetical protein [Planomicrobium sp. CPCC 101079]|uniref:hypothetical protein n=1 Tax=Planomicrobium sp. CPCC 101079 TaxID=2599618 RepID=UPI0011B5E2BE|nr:hypothetical protein [Planomicrobium sp. CPCC 101079]
MKIMLSQLYKKYTIFLLFFLINGNYSFSVWDNGIDNYEPLSDMALLYAFLEELNNSKPLPQEQNFDPIGDSQNNEEYKELTVDLDDGSRIRLTLLKDGYIYYGFMGVYFEMNQNVFATMWSLLQ